MMIDNKHWKPACVFPEHYFVSDKGEVYSVRTGKVLRPGVDKDGYLTHILCVNGKRRTARVHRLVAMAFIPNPDGKPAIDHINEDKQDNRIENLRWVTNRENSNNPLTLNKLRKHAKENCAKMYITAIKRGFGRKAVAVYKDGVLIQIFRSQRLAAQFIGGSEGDVSGCLSGTKKTCHGFTFKRVDDKF